MGRIADLAPEAMTPEQRRIANDIGAARGGVVRGPFAIWLRNPEIADRANQFGNALRIAGKLDKRLFELMILVVARHWSAQYEWFAHEKQARENGVSDAVIEAIRHRRKPVFERADEALVYDLVSEMNETRTLSQPTYDLALAHFGQDLMIELVTSLGFYTMVAVVLNGFDAPVPDGTRPLP
ncbi:MAG: carboxymuconolactone decarboxylase family protein [Burkholderiales bacterium]